MFKKLKIAVNISYLFKEAPYLERFALASKSGFKAIESSDEIYNHDIDTIVKTVTQANVEVIQIVAPKGTLETDEGIGCLPGREEDFLKIVNISFEYANALKCKRVLFTSGILPNNVSDMSVYEATFINNLKIASSKAVDYGITVLVEPLSSKPGLFLSTQKIGISIVKQISLPNMKLQYDFYHAQRSDGNITNFLRANIAHIGHIQVGQVPHRQGIDSEGELNLNYILKVLIELNYVGWISAEYIPPGKTEDSLDWLSWFSTQ